MRLPFLLLQSTHPATDPEAMPSDAPKAELEPGLMVLCGSNEQPRADPK